MAAQGLWINMLALMSQSDPFGHLMDGKATMTVSALTHITRQRIANVKRWLEELETHNVYSKDPETDAIYCRRFVREHELSIIRAGAGKLGGKTTGALIKQKSSKNKSKSIRYCL